MTCLCGLINVNTDDAFPRYFGKTWRKGEMPNSQDDQMVG